MLGRSIIRRLDQEVKAQALHVQEIFPVVLAVVEDLEVQAEVVLEELEALAGQGEILPVAVLTTMNLARPADAQGAMATTSGSPTRRSCWIPSMPRISPSTRATGRGEACGGKRSRTTSLLDARSSGAS